MPKPDALRAANRLLVDATLGTTAMVEAVHASVLGWPRRLVGLQPAGGELLDDQQARPGHAAR